VGPKGRKSPRSRTPVATEEAVYAKQIELNSYRRTAEFFGMPFTTVWHICERLGRDSLEQERTALRARLMRDALGKAAAVIVLVEPGELGSERSSRGAEAARALADMGRFIQGLEPKKDQDVVIPEIHVFTGIAPPSEDEAPVQPATGPDGKVTIQ
jgi:hypothetical protein